jgi:hypothetical protein
LSWQSLLNQIHYSFFCCCFGFAGYWSFIFPHIPDFSRREKPVLSGAEELRMKGSK